MLSLLLAVGLFDALREADRHVANVAWRLQTSNAPLCRFTNPLSGLILQNLSEYASRERAEAVQHGLGELPQISAVALGSPADQAGLQPGMDLLAINRIPTRNSENATSRGVSVPQAMRAQQLALQQSPLLLSLRDREVVLKPVTGCAGFVEIVPGPRFDATAGTEYVQITGTMFEFLATDDELAFVVGHELSHIALGHQAPGSRRLPGASNLSSATAEATSAPVRELEADALGIWMMARAGYDPDAVIPFMRRARKKVGLTIMELDHPSWKRRIANAATVIAEVRAATVSGRALIPPQRLIGNHDASP